MKKRINYVISTNNTYNLHEEGGGRFLKRTFFLPSQVHKTISLIWFPDYRSLVFLHQKYVVEGRSIAKIADLTFSSTSTVHKYLTRFNIPLRSLDTKTTSHLKYGEIFRAGAIRTNQQELATISKIKGLRERGFSYWKIADVLNAMKVPTKTGRGRWHARFVQKLLER